jgi:hypothetical protein
VILVPSQNSDVQEIVGNLVSTGFRNDDIIVMNNVVYAGRDDEVSLMDHDEVARGMRSRHGEHIRRVRARGVVLRAA